MWVINLKNYPELQIRLGNFIAATTKNKLIGVLKQQLLDLILIKKLMKTVKEVK